MKDTEAAFKWIISLLQSKNIQFQIAGGFAVRLYGSNRELADVDIDIRNSDFEKILEEVKDHIIWGPERYVDENWDLQLMTLEYKGQMIDIAGEAKIFDQNSSQWVEQLTDFSNNNLMTVYGISIPVIQKDALVSYKKSS